MASDTTRDRANADLKQRWLKLRDELQSARDAGDDRRVRLLECRLDQIGSDFCANNRGLATVVARQFLTSNSRANHDDYVSAALEGLWEAFQRWNPAESTFGNFSRLYIEGRVKRAVASFEAEGISYGDFSARQLVRQAERHLTEELGRPPTTEEIAAASGQSTSLVDRVRQARPVSLDTPVGDGESSLGDLVAESPDDTRVDDFIDRIDNPEVLHSILASQALSAPELFVYIRRRGIDAAPDQTLNEVVDMIGLGRETVRRHETRAFAKVRELLERCYG